MTALGYPELFRNQEFRALWTGSALGGAAGTVAALCMGTLVYAETGSPLLAAATMLGPSLVQLAGVSTLMSAADAVRRRHALSAHLPLIRAAQPGPVSVDQPAGTVMTTFT